MGLLDATIGPIGLRELTEVARQRSYFVYRTALGVTVLLVFGVIWQVSLDEQKWFRGSNIAYTTEVARSLFLVFSWLELLAVWLFTPALVCGAIAGERENGSWDLLLATPLSDRQIVFGKLLARLGVTVMLLASLLPVFSLVSLFGGIDPEGLWWSQAQILTTTLTTASVSLFFSTVSRSGKGAIAATYMTLALHVLVLPALLVPLAPVWETAGLLVVVNPLLSFAYCLHEPVELAVASVVPGWMQDWLLPASFALPLLVTAAGLVLSLAYVREPDGQRKWQSKVDVLKPGREVRHFRDRPDQYKVRFSVLFGEIVNPLWLRGRLLPVYDRFGTLRPLNWGLVGLTVLGLVVAAFVGGGVLLLPVGLAGAAAAWWLVVWTVAAGVASGSLVQDRRSGILDLLMTTPISDGQILRGTLAAVWHHVYPLLWTPLVLYGLWLLTGSVGAVPALLSLGTGLLVTLFMAHAGMVLSLTSANANRIRAAAVTLVALLPCGTVFLENVGDEMLGRHVPLPEGWPWYVVTPAAAVLVLSLRERVTPLRLAGAVLATLFVGQLALAEVARVAFPLNPTGAAVMAAPLGATLATLDDGRRPSDERDARRDRKSVGRVVRLPATQPSWRILDRTDGRPGTWGLTVFVLLIWTLLVLHMALLHGWTLHHFGRLTGRTAEPR